MNRFDKLEDLAKIGLTSQTHLFELSPKTKKGTLSAPILCDVSRIAHTFVTVRDVEGPQHVRRWLSYVVNGEWAVAVAVIGYPPCQSSESIPPYGIGARAENVTLTVTPLTVTATTANSSK